VGAAHRSSTTGEIGDLPAARGWTEVTTTPPRDEMTSLVVARCT
jgi:hypothetical protein